MILAAQRSLSQRAHVQVHVDQTKACNAAGEEPFGLLAAAAPQGHESSPWVRGWASLAEQRGLLVLGSPISSREFIIAALAHKRRQHDALLDRLPHHVPGLQSLVTPAVLCRSTVQLLAPDGVARRHGKFCDRP